MANWKCEKCGNDFKTPRRRTYVHRFCSQFCYHAWSRENNAYRGTFQKGMQTWNAGTKGVMKSNRTSFQKGILPATKCTIGTERIRRCRGKLRTFIKVSDGRKSYDWTLKCIIVWQKTHGQVPKGMLIHHADRNTLNDDIDNLKAMTRGEHLQEHRGEHAQRRSAALRRCSGTTAHAAENLGRNWIGLEIRESQVELTKRRLETK